MHVRALKNYSCILTNQNGKRYYITLLGVNFSVEGDKRSQLVNAIHKWALSDLIK